MHIQSFINGVAVGFLLGILYAPNRGEETRRKISERASGIKNTVKNTYDAVSDTVTKVKDKAGEILNKQKDDGTGSVPNMGTMGSQAGTL